MAVQSLLSIMNDCDWLNQTILQWLSQSPTAWEIDAEIGDLRSDLLGGQPQLSYLRYNVLLDHDWLQTTLGIDTDARDAASLEAPDNPANMVLLAELGRKAAETQVRGRDWPACFDLHLEQSGFAP
jgi:hypothetical protein